jgi:rhamnogalacturonyl hydrolase YesR
MTSLWLDTLTMAAANLADCVQLMRPEFLHNL